MCLELGETFSFNDVIGPRTAQWGYKLAEIGRGVRVRGGGAAQLATTVYQAVRQAGIADFSELHFYGDKFADNYAVDGDSAVLVDYANEQDMAFFNSVGTMTFYTEASEYGLFRNGDGGRKHGAPSTPSGALISSAYTIFSSGEDQQFNAMRAACRHFGRAAGLWAGIFVQRFGGRAQRADGLPRGREWARGARARRWRGANGQHDLSGHPGIWPACASPKSIPMATNYNQSYVASSDEAILLDYGVDDFRFQYVGQGASLSVVLYQAGNLLYCEIYEAY